MDEFEGMGGSYAVDPKTGKRKLVQRTGKAQPNPQPTPEPEQPDAKE